MTFKNFCEMALSNDLIAFADDCLRARVIYPAKPCYLYLLPDEDERKPKWSSEVLEKEIDRVTISNCADVGRVHFLVSFK